MASINTSTTRKFPPICSDFVIELRSGTDLLERLPEKMQEYLNRGLALGWLIDSQNQQVKIYQLNQSVEVVSLPAHLLEEDILSRFVLDIPLLDKKINGQKNSTSSCPILVKIGNF